MLKNFEGFLLDLLNRWDLEDQTYPLMQARFQKIVNKYPQETLDTLFFNIYFQYPKLLNFTRLRAFLSPQFNKIHLAISDYLNFINSTPASNIRALINREVRFICREIILLSLTDLKTRPQHRCQLRRSLKTSHPNEHYYNFQRVNMQEVIEQIPYLLRDAELIAELPDFSGVYFSKAELAPVWNSLQQYQLTPEDETNLESFLNHSIKKQVLSTLETFVQKSPDSLLVKKACAIYITLGEIIPWTKHAFIRRLLAVSYQEAITTIALQK